MPHYDYWSGGAFGGGTSPLESWPSITTTVADAPWLTPEQLVAAPTSSESGPFHQPIYGQIIPAFRGTIKGGWIFWFKGPEERNGGVYADFAVAIARNEWQKAGVLLDVDADDTRIYDARRGGRTSGRFTLRIYDGISNAFDSTMLAENGAATTVAYHGLIYLFFEDFDCGPFGNRIPVVRATWTDTAVAASGTDDTLPLLATDALGYTQTNAKLCYDRALEEFYNFYEKTGEVDEVYIGVTAFDDSRVTGLRAGEVSLAKVVNKPVADISVLYGACALPGTGLFLCLGYGNTNNWDLLIDAQTGSVLASYEDGVNEEVAWFGALQFPGGSSFIACGRYIQTNAPATLSVAFASVNIDAPSVAYLPAGTAGVGDNTSIRGIAPGRADADGVTFYVGQLGGKVFEALFTELAAPAWRQVYDAGTEVTGIDYDLSSHSLVVTTLTGAVRNARRVDAADGSVDWTVVIGGNATGGYIVMPRGGAWSSLQDMYSVATTHRLRPGYALLKDVGDGVAGETARLMDLRDGSSEVIGLVSGSAAHHYDQYSGTLFNLAPDVWNITAFARYSPGEVTIAEILTDFATYDGLLTAGQVETVGLAGLTTQGVYIDRDSDLRELTAQICALYGIDKVETGSGVRFIKKSTDALFTADVAIAEADLVESRSGDITTSIQSRRKAENEIPQEIEVQFRDVDADYTTGSVSASRPTGTFSSTKSRLRKTLSVPLVMTSTKARQLATPALYRQVAGRTIHNYTVSRRHLALEPSDVAAVTADGYVRLLKTLRAVKRADNAQEITAEEYLTTVETTVAAPTTILQAALALGPGYSRYIHLDTALLRYLDDTAGASLVSYAVLASRGQDNWPGAVLWRRRAGGLWERASSASEAPVYAVAQGALPAPPVTFETDLTNTLTIKLVDGVAADIATVTYLAMMNGANRAALGAPGRWMILAWQNAVVNGNGTITLNTILQGLNGTEVFQATSRAGDFFIPLRPDLFEGVAYEVADHETAVLYRAVGRGLEFESAPNQRETISGTAETPYAPTWLRATVVASDIALEWTRRTRLSSPWPDGGSATEGPLGEAVELYKVEILAGPAGAVLRTFAAEPDETMTYVAANIATDFGSMPANLTYRVSQWSAAVGWGYAAKATIPLA